MEPSALVIDLKPNVKRNVSLYEVLDVWGYSYHTWTPIAVCLRELYVDDEREDASTFKDQFDHAGTGHLVGEFLYVQGGVGGGTWNWGMVGRVNGALLWRDAFAFLSGALGKRLGVVNSPGHG
jgi:hypothetical protein